MLAESSPSTRYPYVEEDEITSLLPPTPITTEAWVKLKHWGFPDRYIDRLAEMISLFRYDRSPQKAARVARAGGYLFNDDAEEKIALPNFFDSQTRLDGQCGDLAAQMVRALNFSGFLDELNEILTAGAKPRIFPAYCVGQSATHFNVGNAVHVWTGLTQEGIEHNEHIVADPAFQVLTEFKMSGYKLTRLAINPKTLMENRNAVLPVVQLTVDGDNRHSFKDFRSTVIGSSFDSKFVYTIGFSRRSGVNRLYPFVSLVREEGGEADTSCLLGDDGEPKWLGNLTGLTDRHGKEVEGMLRSLETMAIETNQERGLGLSKEERLTIVSRKL